VLANSGVSDVREVLDYYNKELDPLDTFKLNQVKLKVMIELIEFVLKLKVNESLFLNFKGSRV
jgi:hypothetical protein